MKFDIYYTETAKEEIYSMSAKRLEQLSIRIDRLKEGKWQNGTRVKKLKSLNHKRTIYEARVDGARRMLFTIVKNRSQYDKTALLIFHFEVEHDKVIHSARSLMQDDYPSEQYKKEKEREYTLEELAEETRPIWQDGNEEYHAYLNQLKSYELDDESLYRMMRRKELNEDEFYEMKISLSEEQRSLASVPLPFLLSGTAGSGKTTIVIHKLIEMDPNITKLYITYTKDLCKEAKQMFYRLVKGLDDEEKYINNVVFKTFDELMRELQQDKVQDIITRERFLLEYKKLFRTNHVEKDFPALIMWEELRGVWKGGVYGQNYILTEQEYLGLTKDQAPNFVTKREQAYALFQRYQDMLTTSHKIDEQDLLNEAIQFNNQNYDYVFCDEVQDLSMLHLLFLYELTGRNATNLFLTGDDQQILHQSGFRWATIKDLFTSRFHHKPPALEHLTMNYRSVGAITDLAMAINKLEKTYTTKKIKAKPAQSLHYGEKPFYFSKISEESMLEAIHHFGPHQAIIVRSHEEKERLRTLFQNQYQHTPLIFTIFEIKGLEFERILIWNFFPRQSDESQFWENTIRQIELGREEKFKNDTIFQRQLASETNLLYVAVTRGSLMCYIYDGEQSSSFWNIPSIKEKMQVLENLAMFKQSEEHQVETTDYDWIQEGLRLLKKTLYDQALDCFNRVPQTEEINCYRYECLGFIARKNENFEEATEHFKKAGLHEEVIATYDILEEFAEAVKYIKQVIKMVKESKEKDYWTHKSNQFHVKDLDKRQIWKGSGIYCNNHLSQHYEGAIRFERDQAWGFAKDAYERALHTCNPFDKKRYNMLWDKYQTVLQRMNIQ